MIRAWVVRIGLCGILWAATPAWAQETLGLGKPMGQQVIINTQRLTALEKADERRTVELDAIKEQHARITYLLIANLLAVVGHLAYRWLGERGRKLGDVGRFRTVDQSVGDLERRTQALEDEERRRGKYGDRQSPLL